MASFDKKSITIAAAVILIFLSLITNIMPYGQEPHHLRFSAEGGACIDYDQSENTIAIDCNASFLDVVQIINDPDAIDNLGGGEYILNANLEVADDVTFEMTSSNEDSGGLQYLKIAGENGIIVQGKILINGVKITSRDVSDEDVIQQNIDGAIRRAYVQFAASEGSQIINSDFGYLGYQDFGRRGFDLFGDGPSHDMEIRGSKFHNMWFAFYSRGAYNITVDGNEYYNNIKYALDPHSGTHDMSITNNWLHHNPIGAICSDRCSDILIEGNRAEHNTKAGIFFSRNMHDSIARNNYIYNTTTGIIVSESPNNQIYSNTIEGATGAGIRLSNPPNPDDGFTEDNHVYNNTISNSEDGIREIRSDGNILEDNKFFNIESDDDDND
jgi:parallel beta-helix repeat protein